MDSRKSLGKAIKTIRCLHQKTQEDLSPLVSRTYISCLENGQKSPTVDKLEQIAEALTIHPAAILLIASVLSAPEKKDQIISEITRQAITIATTLGL